MNNDFDLYDVVKIFKKRWKTILAVIVLFTLVGGYVSYQTPTIYEARADLLVNYTKMNEESEILQSSDIEMSLRLIETYKEILKSDRLLNKVASQLDGRYTKEELQDKVSITSGGDSQIIKILAEAKTAEEATTIVKVYATLFQEDVRALMNLDNINILNELSMKTDVREVSSSTTIFIGLSGIAGFILIGLVVIGQEMYFFKLNTPAKIESTLGIQNFGSLPVIKNARRRRTEGPMQEAGSVPNINDSFFLAEEFRKIRANIQYHLTQKKMKVILVTSPTSGDGKSLVAVNLALAMAMTGKKTVFIDADLRSPIGKRFFNIPSRDGLTSFISRHVEFEKIVHPTNTTHLSFIGTGPIPPNPTEILSSSGMEEVIQTLKPQYDVIVIDTPPLIVADAVSLSTYVDGCLYVVNAKQSGERLVNKSLEQLKRVRVPVLGAVLNKSYPANEKYSHEF